MPIFEYQCEHCAQRFEQLVIAGRPADPQCPACNGRRVEKLMSGGSIRPQGIPKGSGGFKPPACARSGR